MEEQRQQAYHLDEVNQQLDQMQMQKQLLLQQREHRQPFLEFAYQRHRLSLIHI